MSESEQLEEFRGRIAALSIEVGDVLSQVYGAWEATIVELEAARAELKALKQKAEP